VLPAIELQAADGDAMARKSTSSSAQTETHAVHQTASIQTAPKRKRLIIFVHGIRDPGYWQQDLKQLFEAEGFIAVPIGYGVFDIMRFILGFRGQAVEEVKMKIKAIIDNNTDETTREVPEITILAHSFGTYVVSRILDDDPTIDIKRLVMCGGIVSRSFRWDKLARLNGQFGERVEILNEHSAKDIWPLFAHHFTLGFGATGTIGCQDGANVKDRRHNIPHSGYLNRAFAEKFWIPHISQGQPLVYNTEQMAAPWYTNLLTRSPFTFLQAAAMGLMVCWAYLLYDKISYRTQGVLSYETSDAGLVFSIQGRRSRDEDWQPLFSARSSSTAPEHRLLSMARHNNLRVEISNRQPINCNPESLEDEILERTGNVKTTYIFDLTNAHKWLGKTDISFSYLGEVIGENAKKFDRLDVSASGGLDQDAIRLLLVKHEGDKCLDENNPFDSRNPRKTPFVRFLRNDAEEGQIASLLGPAIAWAGEQKKPDIGTVLRSLKSKNPRVVEDSIEVLASEPQTATDSPAGSVRDLVRNGELTDDALAKLLSAARDSQAMSLKLDNDMIVGLTYHDNVKVRDAARSYARAPLNAGPQMVNAFEDAIARDLQRLRGMQVEGKAYGKDYLLLIAARDVYYNYGITRMDEHLSALQNGRNPDFADVAAIFQKGRELRNLAADDRQKVSLAKNTYGLALAQLRVAALVQALQVTGGKDPQGFILKARSGNEPLQDSGSKAAFAEFLQETTALEKLYPWQNHITVARRCLEAVTYACYVETVSAE
jgi:pimeloyl-ACP methyl ester carboxylesterase